MNTALTRIRKTEEGSSLLLVTILIVIAFMLLGSALSWSSHNAVTIARNSQYWRTVAAAEAATEKVLSRLAWDFLSQELPFFAGDIKRPIDVLKTGNIEAVVKATRAYGEAFT